MKEQGMFFTEEQKQLLQQINDIEQDKTELEDERKSLSTTQRMLIADKISNNYSMLNKEKGIFGAQLFSAMEDYLR